MTADDRPDLSRWSDFLGSLRMQVCAALAVGLPADEVRQTGDEDEARRGESGRSPGRSAAGTTARRYTDGSPGYLTRNGLGSLEVGAFRDRPSD